MYKEYNDQELIYLIAENNEDASNILYNKYKDIVNMKAKKYMVYASKVGIEYKDLVQEGMVGLSEAIKCYSDHKDTGFATFANICIDREILSILKKMGRKKYSSLNDSLSLDYKIDNSGKTLMDILYDYASDPSIKIDKEEKLKELYERLYKELSPFEKNVFDLKMCGFEYKEIGNLLNKSYKSIDSALQRIRVKVRKALDEYEN